MVTLYHSKHLCKGIHFINNDYRRSDTGQFQSYVTMKQITVGLLA